MVGGWQTGGPEGNFLNYLVLLRRKDFIVVAVDLVLDLVNNNYDSENYEISI